MKNVWIKISLIVFVLLFTCGFLYFKIVYSDKRLAHEDGPMKNVAEVTHVMPAEDILAINKKYIKAANRNGHNITIDMVDLTKTIRHISTAKMKTKTLVKVRYEDDSLDSFWVKNK